MSSLRPTRSENTAGGATDSASYSAHHFEAATPNDPSATNGSKAPHRPPRKDLEEIIPKGDKPAERKSQGSTGSYQATAATLTNLLDDRRQAPTTSGKEGTRTLALKSMTENRSRPLVMGVIIVAVLGVILSVVLISKYYPKHQGTIGHCTSVECRSHWLRLNSSINWFADPCKNFSAFVCGSWKPDKTSSRSELSSMLYSWQDEFEARLEKAAEDMPVVAKPIAMFKSCRSKPMSNVTIFKQFMANRSLQWPEEPHSGHAPLEILFDLSFNWRAPLWFRVQVIPETLQQPRIIFLSENTLINVWSRFFKEIPSFQAYRVYYTSLFREFSTSSHDPNDDVIQKSYTMQNFVYDVLLNASTSKSRRPVRLPMEDFAKITNLSEDSLQQLRETFALRPALANYDVVMFSDVAVLNALVTILSSLNQTAMTQLLSWMFVQVYGAVADPGNILVAVYGNHEIAERERPRYCSREVEASYELLVAALYTTNWFSAAERRGINYFLGRILHATGAVTVRATWMDGETKAVFIEKLHKLRTVLWPEDELLDEMKLENAYDQFPESGDSFADIWIQTRRQRRLLLGRPGGDDFSRVLPSSTQPYFLYVHALNTLWLSLGALAPPLYHANGNRAMLYGGLGYMYAKELVRAIDAIGVTVHPSGSVGESWIGKNVSDEYEERAIRCLGGTGVFPEVPALEVAHAAYKTSSSSDGRPLSRHFTAEQEFFVVLCHLACGSSSESNIYGGDCNKAMSNFQPFAEAFMCKPGSEMNPATKCPFFA